MSVLTGSDRRRIDTAARALRRVPAQGSPEAVLDALARCAPIVCGSVGTMSGRESNSIVSHFIRLPPEVSEGWVTTPRAHLTRMLSSLVPASPGTLISDTEAITGHFREELVLLQRLRAAGLGEGAGYKVSARPTEAGTRAHRFMTFALDDGQTFTREHHHLLAQLQPAVHAALDRLCVPLVASQSILAQIVEEQTIGFMCLSKNRAIVETNERFHELVMRFSHAASVEGGRRVLLQFVERILDETRGQRVWCLQHKDGAAQVKISTHHLAKESHLVGEDVQLVMMQEFSAHPPARPLDLAGLTGREQEIARLLIEKGLSCKQIADHLAVSPRTVGKHVENIYRKRNVHSRPELVALFR